MAAATVTVGPPERLRRDHVDLTTMVWALAPVDGPVLVQCSAHGEPHPASVRPSGDGATATVHWDSPRPRVAPGQSVVLYERDEVVGGGIAI